MDIARTADCAQANITPKEGQFPTDETSAGNAGIAQASGSEIAPVFSGNKTDFVAVIVRARGISGATPKDDACRHSAISISYYGT